METQINRAAQFRNIIRKNYIKLRNDLDVSNLMGYFFQDKLLELHDMEDIKSIQQRTEKTEIFLRRCLKMDESKAYTTFIKALTELNVHHILKMFEEDQISNPVSDRQMQDVGTQTDTDTCQLTPGAQSNQTPSASLVCSKCGRLSVSNSAYDYDDATSLQRAPENDTKSFRVAEEDEHGYTRLIKDQTTHDQETRNGLQQTEVTFGNVTEAETENDALTQDRRRVILTQAMSEPTHATHVSVDFNTQDLSTLEMQNLEGWRPDVNETNVKDKAKAYEGQQGRYFIWLHKRSKRNSLTASSRSSVYQGGRFIVSVWNKGVLLHYKVLDKRDKDGQVVYYVDKSVSSSSITKLIGTLKVKGISVKEDKI